MKTLKEVARWTLIAVLAVLAVYTTFTGLGNLTGNAEALFQLVLGIAYLYWAVSLIPKTKENA